MKRWHGLCLAGLLASALPAADPFQRAAGNGIIVDDIFRRTNRVMKAWLAYADKKTLLLPDRLPGARGGRPVTRLYTPHNSGADLYPYLIVTAYLTDPALYSGRMLEMLRNEIRYTTAGSPIPGNLDLATGKLGPPSLFGAAEYAKDGLLAVTELLGRTPWFYRMVDMTAALMERAPVESAFGRLPDSGAELNGDVLQTLVRLATMTADARFLAWAERIADAYILEVLPANHGLPGYTWDFQKHTGPDRMRLRDHGNEIVVGLVLLYALETHYRQPRAQTYGPAIARMLDRILESSNPDGMLYNEIRCSDLQPLDRRLSDNWGYIYGAVYAFYQVTGEEKYRLAVEKVLRNLPKYRNYDWENGSQDGYADALESALYLVARLPVPEALDWIESEIKILLRFQRPDGTVERWYGDGNWNRTLLLHALSKTQGVQPEGWAPGVQLGAVREGDRLFLSLRDARPRRGRSVAPWSGRLRFDFARHRRVLNLDRNYARLNEWPEWFIVDENTLYRVTDARTGQSRVFLGSEMIAGLPVTVPANWIVEKLPVPADGETLSLDRRY